MARQAQTIEEVIEIMDDIVHDCLKRGDRLGYFASLYRTVTIVVKERCDDGFFEDNDRMRDLDVRFANRYFEAYDAYFNGGTATRAWQVSFDAAQHRNLIILQHLLLGMNAHISLDLGVATAEVADGELTTSLERDFNRLNNILAGLIDKVQEEVGQLSPLLRFLDKLAFRTDETFVSYSINIARDKAWRFAQQITPLTAPDYETAVLQRDEKVARFGSVIGSTRWYIAPALWLVNLSESKNTRQIVRRLSNETWMTHARHHVEQIIANAQEQGVDLAEWQSAQEQIRQTAEVKAIPDEKTPEKSPSHQGMTLTE